jgi:fructokinase
LNQPNVSTPKSSQKLNGRVFALGEALLDLITENGRDFVLSPGGSVVNAALSLSQTRGNVFLLSDFCNDSAGQSLKKALEEKGVNTRYCNTLLSGQSNLALAFLDENKVATYNFYKEYPMVLSNMDIPEFKESDVLLFGSGYAVNPLYESRIDAMLDRASMGLTVIYYDVNVREKSAEKRRELLSRYFKNISQASIAKGSMEDFFLLFETNNPESIYQKCVPYCKNLLITDGAKEVHLFTANFYKKYRVPATEVVSTIGAGDNFNAGFIYGLQNFDSGIFNTGTIAEWDLIVNSAIQFASTACKTINNFIDKGSLQKCIKNNY